MSPLVCLPAPDEIALESCIVEEKAVTIYAITSAPTAACPGCGTCSGHVHSRYRRTLHDLPCQGVPVRIVVSTRRFFCPNKGCARHIFTERLPGTAAPYARRTHRLTSTLRHVALSLGGEAGRRLLQRLGMPASGDTLLRQLHAPEAESAAPRVLGVDEWAWRKRHRYGTLLVDLERHRVVDLLPERSAESFAAWLKAHPSVEVICRDRAPLYAEGAALGAPHAVQVADRWHLLRNLTEALEHTLEGCTALLRQAHRASTTAPPETPALQHPPTEAASRTNVRSAARRARRLARYQEAIARLAQGQSSASVAREVGLSERTLRRWVKAEGFPERKVRRASTCKLSAHTPYLQERLRQGCMNAAHLWRELRLRGFDGSASTVRVYVQAYRSRVATEQARSRKCPSLRRTAWLLSREVSEMRASGRSYVKRLLEQSPELEQAREAALSFTRLLGSGDASRLEAWLSLAAQGVLRGFASSLRRDLAAVRAAVEIPWSNGQTEGQVNRLKVLKRQMYGRASFVVLRARVLAAA